MRDFSIADNVVALLLADNPYRDWMTSFVFVNSFISLAVMQVVATLRD